MTNEKVDVYIQKSAPFAQAVLAHFRNLVHTACPDVEETLKWGVPHFMKDGRVLCFMAAFKKHCAIGFRNAGLIPDPDGVLAPEEDSSLGTMGKIKDISELPPASILGRLILEAVELNHLSVPRKKAKKEELPVPVDFKKALLAKTAALSHFEAFSPAKRTEYIEWVNEAKRNETRNKRIAQAITWIAEGKQRNWKYIK